MTEEEKKKQQSGEYVSAYRDDMDRLQKQLEERSFRYDGSDDGLYKIYADRYRQQGKLAMRDTLGQTAALTGGYASSYAQNAGQQAYDAYLQKLGDAGLQLYDRAYRRYTGETDALKDRLAGLKDDDETAYGRYLDRLKREKEDRDFEYKQGQDSLDRVNTAYGNLYKLILSSGYIPEDSELSSAGMTRQAAQALREAYLAGLNSGSSSGGRSGKSGTGDRDGGSVQSPSNVYPALLAELRALSAAGSSREESLKRINAAFSGGRITQAQRDYLIRSFG